MSSLRVGSETTPQGTYREGRSDEISAVAAAATSAMPKKDLYGCNVCPQKMFFCSQRKLREHLMQNHNSSDAEDTITTFEQLEKTLKKVNPLPFACGRCNGAFMLLSSLNRHTKQEHLCKRCSKVFDARLALVLHSESCKVTLPTSSANYVVGCDTDLFRDLEEPPSPLSPDFLGTQEGTLFATPSMDTSFVDFGIWSDTDVDFGIWSDTDGVREKFEDTFLHDRDKVTGLDLDQKIGGEAIEDSSGVDPVVLEIPTTNLYGCNICSQGQSFFSTMEGLHNHLEKKHRPRNGLSTKKYFKLLLKENNRPICMCNHCSKPYKDNITLRAHIFDVNHGGYTCQKCSKTFQARVTFIVHESKCGKK
ncbi:MAG: hypothetical protein H7A36_00995 [Chlamydiales bacterium]|nr:hypothetical protein [Chlamydiales bacterium]